MLLTGYECIPIDELLRIAQDRRLEDPLLDELCNRYSTHYDLNLELNDEINSMVVLMNWPYDEDRVCFQCKRKINPMRQSDFL